ncbi:phosphatase PAP2 family protein [Solimonas soli]|uniref:phosphatase PAP2 family protein n=1 Tax=Solimonas soli TaxID=413479 RepID=UPI000688369B|nr:phosphatase PAP2 family protein [Solimonas soli]
MSLVRRLQLPPAAPGQHRWLLSTAMMLSLGALVLLLGGGYHAGFHTLNDAGRGLGDRSVETLTQAGDTLFVLSVFLSISWRHPRAVWHAVLAALIATLLSHGIKICADQLRPPAVLAHDSFRQLGPPWRRDSFPSGHSVTAFVAAAALACEWRERFARALALGVAALIAASRVAVGAHWPVDILAGAAVGLLAAWLALHAMRRWRWGLRLPGHLAIVALLGACAVADFVRVPAYAAAQPAVRAAASIGLALALWHYVLVPLWRGRPLRGAALLPNAEGH